MTDLVDLTVIAEAVGQSYKTLRANWIAHPAWPPHHNRSGLGGAKRWRVDDLPTAFHRRGKSIDVQALVEAHLARQALALPSPPALPKGGGSLPPPCVSPPEAPAEILAGLLLPRAADGHAKARSAEALRRMELIAPLLTLPEQSRGRRAVAEAIAARSGESLTTLYRWCRQYRGGGGLSLERKPRRDAGQARVLVSEEFERLLTGLRLKPAHVEALARRVQTAIRGLWRSGGTSVAQVWGKSRADLYLGLLDLGMPAEQARTVHQLTCPRRMVEAERQYALVALAERDAKTVYDRHQPSVLRSRAGMRPGELVFGDVSPADIPVLRPDGSTAYVRLICWMDAATCWVHVTWHLAEKGEGVRQAHVARSFAAMSADAPFGMPLRLYLDNGSEYQWESMLEAWSALANFTGQRLRVEFSALEADCGRIVRSVPYRPKGKGEIEGWFGNFRQFLGWHPAFQGGDRMRKKSNSLGKEPEAATLDDFRALLNAAVADYHGTAQQGQLGGRSPAAALDAHLEAGWRPVRVDPAALLLAFSDLERRRCVGGKVHMDGRVWYADCLVGLDQWVNVRLPKHDREVLYLFDGARFLGVATPERAYGLLDPAGAKESGRRNGVLRAVVNELRGQVAQIDPIPLMHANAAMADVSGVVERAQAAAVPVELSDEARVLLKARAAEADKAARRVLAAAAQSQSAENVVRFLSAAETPEEAAARARFGD